jgi:hypothetical protein
MQPGLGWVPAVKLLLSQGCKDVLMQHSSPAPVWVATDSPCNLDTTPELKARRGMRHITIFFDDVTKRQSPQSALEAAIKVGSLPLVT